ncbi:MAG: hypothetical protein C4278_00620 [Patescibacteria group bacterium]
MKTMINQQNKIKINNVKNLNFNTVYEGVVINKKKGELYVDLSPFGIGRLFGMYYLQCQDIAQKVNVGDKIGVQIIGLDDGYGNLKIILKDIRQIDKWQRILECQQSKKILELEPKEANRGGLIIELEGIQGFLPVSQLTPENYPRVISNNKDQILDHLKKLIGKKLQVRIWIADPVKNKLVFSEKLAKQEIYEKILSQFQVGQIIEVKVVGYGPFGLFVRFHENPAMDGLIHLSEIPNELASDLQNNFPLGKVIKAKLVQLKIDKVNFTLKDLRPDPWLFIEDYLKENNVTKGILKEKNNIFGVVEVKVADIGEINGFVFEGIENLEIGKEYDFLIEKINPKERNLILKPVENAQIRQN